VTHINKGKPFPLGSSITSQGVNFSLIATNAEYVEILLFEKEDSISPKSIFKLDQTHNKGPYWHAEIKNLDIEDKDLIEKLGKEIVKSKYGNLFQMYEKIVDQNPYETPMMIYPAVHYTMGGVWVDYNLMTTIPGCFAIGEANFSDHGANRLGASALMQGLADGYFVLPYTIGDYLSADIRTGPISTDTKEFEEAQKSVEEKIEKLLSTKGSKTVDYFHKKLGKIIWNKCGMARNKKGLNEAIQEVKELRKEFYKSVNVTGKNKGFNETLSKALRVADFLELGELFAKDALDREESCGGHFREEHQTTGRQTVPPSPAGLLEISL